MWFTAKECLGLPEMPTTVHKIRAKLDKLSERQEGVFRQRQGSKAFEYHISCLPAEAQKHLRNVEAKKQLTEVVEKFNLDEVLKRKAAEAKQKGEDDRLCCVIRWN
ncbi:DNA-binding protein [Vibrio campbellii]|uniref:DNA-binding protein n=1 Tax=Vibrio campbellii TaxID=680 RepID=UPI001F30D6AF|nr:DNA-binding protein [Vibrio campbellii]MCE7733186.1 hypothetical protein [Vibrio campbellii]